MSKKELTNNEVAEVIINTAVEGKNILTDGIEVADQLKSKKLATFVKSYYSKVTGVTKSQWEALRKIGAMCEEDLFSEDFASWKELGEFLGMGKTEMSLNRKLAQYNTIKLEGMGFTVSKAYELTKLDNDQLETFLEETPDAAQLTQKELRAAVKEFKVALLEDKDSEESGESAESGEVENSKLTDLDNTAEELTVDYTLPVWIARDGGYVSDLTLTLTESQSEELSKEISAWLMKNGYATGLNLI